MKKIVTMLLVLSLGLLTAGCGEQPAAESPSVGTEPSEGIETTLQETEPLAEDPEGTLFFTVSELYFSAIGEQEDIYAGSVPRDQVTFVSADESIVYVEDGVLTAAGVGTTKITASWKDQEISCIAGCVAENWDDLLSRGPEVFRKPKRVPPETPDSCKAYFQNTAMVGDSITAVLMPNEKKTDLLGGPTFLARGGISIFSLTHHGKLLSFRGKETKLEDAVSQLGLDAVFIQLGQNDLAFMDVDETFDALKLLIERMQESNPDTEIYVESCFPVYCEFPGKSERNQDFRSYNEKVKAYMEDKGCHYMNVAPYVEDHVGGLADLLRNDLRHLNPQGCNHWMKALRAYMYIQDLQKDAA